MPIHTLCGVALITGAAAGIGKGTAIAFVEAGCRRLCLGDINQEGLAQTQDELLKIAPDAEVLMLHLDIGDEQSVLKSMEQTIAKFGRLDYACNVAGIELGNMPIQDMRPDDFDRIVQINAHGTFLCQRTQIQQMLKQDPDSGGMRGSIVSVSSLAGLNASPGLSAYCSTKHAIIAMVKTDALDYGPQGIRINAICPGPTETEAFSTLVNDQQKAIMGRAIPMQRVGTPKDMGHAIVFLSSHYASYIHGVALNVDGGSFIRKIYFNKETW